VSEIELQTPRGVVTLRPAREADAEAYRALRLEGLAAHPRAFGADIARSAARPPEYWQDRMRRGAAGPEGVTYLAAAAETLVGITVLVRGEEPKTRHGAGIFGVYVRPAWRGAGVADGLLRACIAHARAIEVRLLKLGVAADNASAIGLYLRCGFTVYGVEPDALCVDGAYVDELLMALRL
jgi:RimJ/RimL family protein N-acetyltransferase